MIKALKTADVVIGAIHSSEGMSPCIVTEEMVKQMKGGTVMIDVSINGVDVLKLRKLPIIKTPFLKNMMSRIIVFRILLRRCRIQPLTL
ncbi:MAG: hypothetical protein R2764_14160 [Bacteroidales bacterium]